jgi:purine-binding chemotaxis protein CheW
MTPTDKEKDSSATWDSIRRLVEISRNRLAQLEQPSEAQQKAILELRAEKLAVKESEKKHREKIDLVEFRLADERYGVECRYVREVYPLKTLTPIPGTPDFVRGIVSVRGEIISVVDLKKFFQMPQRGLSDLTRVIILSGNDRGSKMEFGILAEEVMGTVSMELHGLQTPLPTLTGIRADYLKGISSDRLAVLDAPKLLFDKKIIVHQEAEL